MRFLIFIASFCFSALALGDYSPDDHHDDPSYSCDFKGQTSRFENFRYRSGAENFCKQYGSDHCKVTRISNYQWRSNFSIFAEFNFNSNESWEHARSNVFNLFNRYITANDYFYEYYRHSFQFGRCYDYD